MNTIAQALLDEYLEEKAPKICQETMLYCGRNSDTGQFHISLAAFLDKHAMSVRLFTRGKDCILQVQPGAPSPAVKNLPMFQVVLSQKQKRSLEDWLEEEILIPGDPLILLEDTE